MAQCVRQKTFAVIHLLDVPRVAAKQVVLQVQPVLHHLKADSEVASVMSIERCAAALVSCSRHALRPG
jgi:hypothetical protein